MIRTGDLKRNGLPAIYGTTTSHPGLAPESRQPDPFPERRGVIQSASTAVLSSESSYSVRPSSLSQISRLVWKRG